MELTGSRRLNLVRVFVVLFIVIIFLPPAASSEEIYQFERMWPTLQQPWYFAPQGRIAVDEDNFIYVLESENERVRKFNRSGLLVTGWGRGGSGGGPRNG